MSAKKKTSLLNKQKEKKAKNEEELNAFVMGEEASVVDLKEVASTESSGELNTLDQREGNNVSSLQAETQTLDGDERRQLTCFLDLSVLRRLRSLRNDLELEWDHRRPGVGDFLNEAAVEFLNALEQGGDAKESANGIVERALKRRAYALKRNAEGPARASKRG